MDSEPDDGDIQLYNSYMEKHGVFGWCAAGGEAYGYFAFYERVRASLEFAKVVSTEYTATLSLKFVCAPDCSFGHPPLCWFCVGSK